LTERSVRFTATAQGHVAREQQWWLENRDYRDVFATELEEAVRLAALMPGAGTSYSDAQQTYVASTCRRLAATSTHARR